MDEILNTIQNAIGTGEVLKIKYHGGSQPGSIREIVPNKLDGDKFFAFCHTSKRVKQFAIDKIEIIPDSEIVSYNLNNNHELHKTLQDVYHAHKDEWDKIGWYIEFKESSIGLHKKWKNGKPLKNPDISIYYEETTLDYIDTLSEKDKITYHLKENQRPWNVRSKGKNTITFKRLDKAIERFLEYIKN